MGTVTIQELSNYTTEPRGIKTAIILHWSASTYESVFKDYHINITGDGDIWIDGTLADRRSHTWRRNTPSIGISLSAMYGASITREGTIKEGKYPPTATQIDTMAKVVAKLCIEIGIPLNQVFTHAEIADKDGYGLKSGDADIRWDLIFQGDCIREKAKTYMEIWGYKM